MNARKTSDVWDAELILEMMVHCCEVMVGSGEWLLRCGLGNSGMARHEAGVR
jgi:hypothetical protein